MIVRFRLFCCFVLAAVLACGCATSRAKHVFIVSIDGGKPAVIAQSHMPVLKQMVAEGAHTWEAKTIIPSLTLPSHTSMLTGVPPDQHKILWNVWKPEKGIVQVPTIFAEAKKAGFATAMFVGKEKFRQLVQPGSLDMFNYDQAQATEVTKMAAGDVKPVKEDSVLAPAVAAQAARYILEHKPGLCFIHFPDPDNEGHKHGWGSPQQIEAFGQVDAALGVVMAAIRQAGIERQSVVLVTADHGGHGKTHGLGTPEDVNIPWIAWGVGVRKGFDIKTPVGTCDTAATALWLLDVPRPANFTGQPVKSAFE